MEENKATVRGELVLLLVAMGASYIAGRRTGYLKGCVKGITETLKAVNDNSQKIQRS